jgi:hypothetical protein
MPISGRAGAAPTLESQEAYPPARSTALAGYMASLFVVGDRERRRLITFETTRDPIWLYSVDAIRRRPQAWHRQEDTHDAFSWRCGARANRANLAPRIIARDRSTDGGVHVRRHIFS